MFDARTAEVRSIYRQAYLVRRRNEGMSPEEGKAAYAAMAKETGLKDKRFGEVMRLAVDELLACGEPWGRIRGRYLAGSRAPGSMAFDIASEVHARTAAEAYDRCLSDGPSAECFEYLDDDKRLEIMEREAAAAEDRAYGDD